MIMAKGDNGVNSMWIRAMQIRLDKEIEDNKRLRDGIDKVGEGLCMGTLTASTAADALACLLVVDTANPTVTLGKETVELDVLKLTSNKCTAYPINGCSHPQFCKDGCKGQPETPPNQSPE